VCVCVALAWLCSVPSRLAINTSGSPSGAADRPDGPRGEGRTGWYPVGAVPSREWRVEVGRGRGRTSCADDS